MVSALIVIDVQEGLFQSSPKPAFSEQNAPQYNALFDYQLSLENTDAIITRGSVHGWLEPVSKLIFDLD